MGAFEQGVYQTPAQGQPWMYVCPPLSCAPCRYVDKQEHHTLQDLYPLLTYGCLPLLSWKRGQPQDADV